MNTPLRSSICGIGSLPSWLMNCGRKARKKIVSLGLRMFSRQALSISAPAPWLTAWLSTAKAERSRQVA